MNEMGTATRLVILEQSEWQCYMFGNSPGGTGFVYTPAKGREPNFFVRWMMKILLDCTWVKRGAKK